VTCNKKLVPDSHVLLQDYTNIGTVFFKKLSETLKSKNLQMARQAKEHTAQQEQASSVKPGKENSYEYDPVA
jgi:hypothetical protein